jgi:hypothetical protein
MRHRLTEIYFRLLPIAIIPCSAFGMANGMRFGFESKDPVDAFCQSIGHASIGIITGFTYPISLPILAGYVLFQKREKE